MNSFGGLSAVRYARSGVQALLREFVPQANHVVTDSSDHSCPLDVVGC
jgi:hypothetical protein